MPQLQRDFKFQKAGRLKLKFWPKKLLIGLKSIYKYVLAVSRAGVYAVL